MTSLVRPEGTKPSSCRFPLNGKRKARAVVRSRPRLWPAANPAESAVIGALGRASSWTPH